MRAGTLIVACSLGAAMPGWNLALADWRNTHWDMSVEQVAALHSDAVPIERLIPVMGEPNVIARLRAGFATGEHAIFYFRDGKLARVEVDYPNAARCPGLLNELRKQYGAPVKEEKIYDVLSVFSWFSGNDEILLRWLDSGAGTGICALVQKKAFG